jgi:ankyrin repeat protein
VLSIEWPTVTPLHEAATFGHVEVVRLLLGHTHPDARNQRKVTPLMLAARNNHTTTVEALLEAGADRAAIDVDGRAVRDYVESPKIKKTIFRSEL